MKVLFVIRDMFVGGAGKQLAMTANALSSFKHEVFVFSYFGQELCQKLDSSVKFISLKNKPKSKVKEYLFTIPNIRKQIKKIRPDVVVSWRCNSGCFSLLASLGLGVKTVFSERTDPYTETSLFLKLSAFVCGFSSGGVFQTEAVRQYYRRLIKKSVVIHNPVDDSCPVPSLVPIEKRRKEIVHVARMRIAHKRQDVMLNAFKLVHERYPDYKLVFYGAGVDFEKVKKMAEDLNLSSCVLFRGAVSNVVEQISCSRALVLTSDYEGIPNVVIEAFFAGTPVVSTDCSPGGARVLIENGKNGFIVPVGDYQTVANKIMKIIDERDLSLAFVNASRVKLNEFRPGIIFEQWNNYLKSLV